MKSVSLKAISQYRKATKYALAAILAFDLSQALALPSDPRSGQAPDPEAVVPEYLRKGLETDLEQMVSTYANSNHSPVQTLYRIPVKITFSSVSRTINVDLGREVGLQANRGSVEEMTQMILNDIRYRLREYKVEGFNFIYAGKDFYDIFPEERPKPVGLDYRSSTEPVVLEAMNGNTSAKSHSSSITT